VNGWYPLVVTQPSTIATTECARLLVSYLLQSTSEANSKWRYKNVIIIIVVAHLGNDLNILPVISKHYPHHAVVVTLCCCEIYRNSCIAQTLTPLHLTLPLSGYLDIETSPASDISLT